MSLLTHSTSAFIPARRAKLGKFGLVQDTVLKPRQHSKRCLLWGYFVMDERASVQQKREKKTEHRHSNNAPHDRLWPEGQVKLCGGWSVVWSARWWVLVHTMSVVLRLCHTSCYLRWLAPSSMLLACVMLSRQSHGHRAKGRKRGCECVSHLGCSGWSPCMCGGGGEAWAPPC